MPRSRLAFGLALLAAGFFCGLIWGGLSPAPGTAKRSGSRAAAAGSLNDGERSTVDLFQQAAPSVVFITSLELRRSGFRFNVHRSRAAAAPASSGTRPATSSPTSTSSRAPTRRSVTLADQATWEAKLVGAPPEKDLAVLQIEAPAEQLRPIAIGTASDLQVGQSVFAIGNPFGLDHTLTTGIISALGREIESAARRADPRRHPDRRGDQPGQLRRPAARQRRPR